MTLFLALSTNAPKRKWKSWAVGKGGTWETEAQAGPAAAATEFLLRMQCSTADQDGDLTETGNSVSLRTGRLVLSPSVPFARRRSFHLRQISIRGKRCSGVYEALRNWVNCFIPKHSIGAQTLASASACGLTCSAPRDWQTAAAAGHHRPPHTTARVGHAHPTSLFLG